MGFCTKRRVFVLFLTITILQIVTTGVRQLFDFLGPLWAMILSNFLNIVFAIFGFFGGYTRRQHYLVTYMVWQILWIGWNLFIICLYLPLPQLKMYKSSVLSLGTGGFSWWETRAPGCIPDWASEAQLNVTNCYFDPKILECAQAGLQVYLSVWGLISSFSTLLRPHLGIDDKLDAESIKSNDTRNRSVPAFMSLSRSRRHSGGGNTSATNSLSSRHRTSSRNSVKRSTMSKQSSLSKNANGGYGHLQNGMPVTNGDPLGVMTDDRLRPMTPRKVKRRSARSIQSSKFGHQSNQQNGSSGNPMPGSSAANGVLNRGSASSGNSNRNSLRSSTGSRRNTAQRNSKRKMNHFVSPINRLIQQQVDSETSHDEPRFHRKELGHINPVYLGPQSPLTSPPPPPRPPSARSSYSNYHPARTPLNATNAAPNAFNLNQNVFTNHAFDNSTEYNNSLMSNNTNHGFYEDEFQYQQHLAMSQSSIPPVPMPMARTNAQGTFHPPLNNFNDRVASNTKRTENPTLVFPLAHSPVSQESFPMWGVAQAQVPSSSPRQPTYPHQPTRPYHSSNNKLSVNSETVI